MSVVAVQVAHGGENGGAGKWAVAEVLVGVEHPAGQQGGGGLGPQIRGRKPSRDAQVPGRRDQRQPGQLIR